jgi:hypothetical protein
VLTSLCSEEYAAAFFLLGGKLKDAVNILSNQLNDMQLAIAVARVYEGDEGPVLEEFLKDKVLPLAVLEGNRWLATWALWMLGKRDKAVRALIVSNLNSNLFILLILASYRLTASSHHQKHQICSPNSSSRTIQL